MLNHLPRIYSMMQIVSMMVFGFVVSQPMFFVMAVNSFSKSIHLSPKKLLAKLAGKLKFHSKFLNFVILMIVVFLFLLQNRFVENVLLIAALLMVFVVISRLLTVKKTQLPANQMMYHWK